MKAAVVSPEDIDRNEGVVGKEARFEDRGRAVVDQFAGELHALISRVVGQIDQHAPRKSVSCQRADLCSLIKAILEHLIGLQLDRVRLVHFPPQQLVALQAGGVLGLGEAERHASNLDVRCDIAIMRRTLWVALFGIAMATVESAVVVYLRALHSGAAPLSVLQYELPTHLLAIEGAREAATLVMLIAVAAVASRNAWEGLLYPALPFGLWGIFYYVWLWVFIGWPPSLFTWDVLFLIPVPWLGPVLAPLIVSLCLVAGALWLLSRPLVRLSRRAWGLAGLGCAVVLVSFTIAYRYALARADPPRFRWEIFLVGIAIAVVGLVWDRRRVS